MTSVVERCARCGGDLPDARIIVGGQKFHIRCSHDARDHRIAELEAALRPFADAVYNDNGDVTISSTHIEVKHYMRAKSLLSQ